MKKIKGASVRTLTVILLALFFIAAPAFSFTDQATTERILADNRSFIDFINTCVTNFASDRTGSFKDIYQMNFNAEVAYLQSDYKRAFKKVYESQRKQADLYSDILRNLYLEDSKNILDRLAPDIIKAKNSRARLYLTLAYRDRAVGWNLYTIGDASNPKLYSYKLYQYVEAIKMTRRAKRYGFLALYESQTLEMKKNIFNHLFEIERETGNPFYNRFLRKMDASLLEEINRNYEEAETAEEKAEDKKTADKGVKDEKGARDKLAEEKKLEKKVEKHVRFRNEKTVAQYLMNSEFEKAEDIIRKYVDDFNFKIIQATFEVMAARNQDKKSASAGGGIDYNTFRVHHLDNYSRLSKQSVLENFAGTVKVEDDIEKKDVKEEQKDVKEEGKDKAKDPGLIKEIKDKAEKKVTDKDKKPDKGAK